MCQGKRLTGPRARERVVAIVGWLHQQGTLVTLDEANTLLYAAGMASLNGNSSVEKALTQTLRSAPNQPANAPPFAPLAPPHVTSEFPLVGRQAEWQTLRAAWHKVLQSHTHFVSIAGEAGIGKTRLSEELLVEVQQQGHLVARTRAYALEGRLAYAPLADWLRSPALVANVRRLDPAWRSELARVLPELLVEDATLSPPKPLAERWQRKRFFEALLHAFDANEDHRPLLLVLDDLQWCDFETLEWLQYLLGVAPHFNLLVVGTVRDAELATDHLLHKLWRDLTRDGQLTRMLLLPLSETETARLGAAVAQHDLTARLAVQLFQESAGNPLFAIESMRSQQGTPREGHAAASSPHASVALPPKVYAVIQSRLAQLSPEARALAEIAAVISRAFTLPLLAQASGQDEATVVQGVDELWQRRLLCEQDNNHYDFSHDRIRDVAYAEIAPGRRSLLHRRVAKSIEALYADHIEDVSAQLAFHLEAAGQAERAIPYLLRAIQKSVELSAMQNALVLVTQGLRITQSLPETEANIRQTIQLYLWQGSMLQACRNWTDPQIQDAYAQVRRLSLQVNDLQSLYLGQTKLRLFYSLRTEWSQAKELAEQNIPLAQKIENPSLLVDAYGSLGRVYFYQGNLPIARQWYEQARVVAEAVQPEHIVKSEVLPAMFLLVNLAHCLCLMGYLQKARRISNEALEIGRTQQDYFSFVAMLHFDLILSHMSQDLIAIRRENNMMHDLAEKYDFPFYTEMSDVFAGWLLAEHGYHQEGIEKLQRGIQYYENQGLGMFHAHRMGMLVEAQLLAGAYAQGLEECEKALAFVDRTSDQFWAPELHRLKGDLILGQAGQEPLVEACYQQAILLSRQQSSKLLELRSSVSLARLWHRQGKCTEAHAMLSAIYGWFTEGFDTPDLKEAKALLEE